MSGVYLNNRIGKAIGVGAVVLLVPLLMFFAYRKPGYFANQTYLGGLLLLECLVLSVWLYRRIFFGIVVMAFLLSGVNLPVGTLWSSARWLFDESLIDHTIADDQADCGNESPGHAIEL